MTEVIELLKKDSHPIRVANATVLPPTPDSITMESTMAADLTVGAQDVRKVVLEMMEDNGLEKASLKVERLAGSEVEDAWHQPVRERLCNRQDPRRTGLEEAGRELCGCADAAVRSCAGASGGRGDRGTCTQDEKAFEDRGTARGTCESGSQWWWWQR